MCQDLMTCVSANLLVRSVGDKDGKDWRLTVPGSLHVALDPLFNRRNILLGVLEVFSDVGCLAARDEAVFGRFARLGMDGPATMLDACREVVGAAVSLGVLKVQVFRASRGVVAKESAVRVS